MKNKIKSHCLQQRSDVPLPALLGLDQRPPGPKVKNKYFFASPMISQRLALLNNIVGSSNLVIVVIGERGSGKTTLMNRFIADTSNRWQSCRIRLKPQKKVSSQALCNLHDRAVFLSRKESIPSIIVDDAHQLSPDELKLLLQSAFSENGERKLQSIVLFAEPQMRARFAEIAGLLPPKSTIDKMFMAPLTEKQTAAYLAHRVKAAGFLSALPFSDDQIRTIHQISKGLPGWINGQAFLQLKQLCAGGRRNSVITLKKWHLPALPKFRWFDKLYAYSRN